jgi:2-polyprenyl-3-methyl-5-hydroxy-6-metoxy-1,4-benzoquinol methylase
MRWSRNVGKYRIQRDLLALDKGRILDVGAVGVGPLDLWRYLPIDGLDVVAVDNDPAGIEKAKRLNLPIDLQCVSGYDLLEHFGAESFDLVISTQVLEHVARPADFLNQIAHVLKPGGELWATLDSGHHSVSHAGDAWWKRRARPIVAKVTEKHYDFGLTETAVRNLIAAAGLTVTDLAHCNLAPLKKLAGQVDDAHLDGFMGLWEQFEAAAGVTDLGAYACIYFRAVR